jgi:hypothetical protein
LWQELFSKIFFVTLNTSFLGRNRLALGLVDPVNSPKGVRQLRTRSTARPAQMLAVGFRGGPKRPVFPSVCENTRAAQAAVNVSLAPQASYGALQGLVAPSDASNDRLYLRGIVPLITRDVPDGGFFQVLETTQDGRLHTAAVKALREGASGLTL